jgi:translation initiation factor IF-1
VSGDTIEAEGVVERANKGDLYAVVVSIGGVRRSVLAKRCGRMYEARIKVTPGDRVRVELSPYDLGRGRIVRRLDERS